MPNITLPPKIEINITKDIIRKAHYSHTYYGDPIYIALKDQLGYTSSVGIETVWINDGKNGIMYKMPKKATKFIKDFDRNKPVHPIKFHITKEKHD